MAIGSGINFKLSSFSVKAVTVEDNFRFMFANAIDCTFLCPTKANMVYSFSKKKY